MSTAYKRTPARKAYRTEWVERWRPPKPLASQRVLEKVLNRHTAVRCPESRLLVAVISVAIVDCLSLTNRHLRRQARRFVLGAELEKWCDLVGLHSDFVRFVARKAGYLADEKAHWQKVPIRIHIPNPLPEPVIRASQSSVRSSAVDATPLNTTGETIHA